MTDLDPHTSRQIAEPEVGYLDVSQGNALRDAQSAGEHPNVICALGPRGFDAGFYRCFIDRTTIRMTDANLHKRPRPVARVVHL